VLVAFIISGFFDFVSVCSAQEYTWTQKTDMPTPRWNLATAVVDGKIYAIGGRSSEPGASSEPSAVALSTVEEYDPVTDTWTRKADMPTVRSSLSASVVSGRIYAIGGQSSEGYVSLSTVEEYDPVTDTWTRKADMPTERRNLTSYALNGKVYAIGGAPSAHWSGLSIVEVYDPATDTWTEAARIPLVVWAPSASVVDGRIYVMGGSPHIDAKRTVQEYDPTTDTWTSKADMMTPRRNFGTSVLCGKIYAIGGWLGSSELPYSSVEMYDPKLDLWTQIIEDLPVRRAAFSASVVNNKIYAIGGTPLSHPIPATSTVYELTVGFQPDFNADFKIDIEDLIILIEHWGQNEPSVDIAPPPCGDGIVDVQDLEILMSYWGQEVYDPRFIAHWKLDETEGDIAFDSAGVYDGILNGGPLWQPTGGAVDGALEFDGVDDYVSTDGILDPADGPFSVFAWVKGGAPGQVVISQNYEANWLLADPSEGKLMTELQGTGRTGGGPLVSQFVITDGNWHRVGFVWDGSDRILYIDDVEVARDTQVGLETSGSGLYIGGLHIGAGSTVEHGSFFSGLIDDVRIYNRAITP